MTLYPDNNHTANEQWQTSVGSKDELEEVNINAIVPRRHLIPNNKLANKITKGIVDGTGRSQKFINKKNKQVTTKALLSPEGRLNNLPERERFTAYDRAVYDAITSLYASGNTIFTPKMIFRSMNGMIKSEYVSEPAAKAISYSIKKIRSIVATIEYSAEAEAYGHDADSAKYHGLLLECDDVLTRISGKQKDAYRLRRAPILYEYAQISKQILSVPIEILQTWKPRTEEGATVRNTKEVIVTRSYLIRSIEGIKSPHFNRSDKIAFKGLFTELGISTDSVGSAATTDAGREAAYRKKTKNIRDHVTTILTAWQCQKYIKGFEQYKIGKTIAGITIIV